MVNILSFHGVQVFFDFSVMISSSCAPVGRRASHMHQTPREGRARREMPLQLGLVVLETASWDANLITIDTALWEAWLDLPNTSLGPASPLVT